MNQENPFPDFVPEVGDVVRITQDNEVFDCMIIRRFFRHGNPECLSINILGFEVSLTGDRSLTADTYVWDAEKRTWYLTRFMDRFLGKRGFNCQIKVVGTLGK